MLAATNHLREKTGPSACARYARIERTAESRDHRVDAAVLWQLGAELRLPEVVHTLLVEPEARRLGAWLRQPGQSADARVEPIMLEWDAVLGAAAPG